MTTTDLAGIVIPIPGSWVPAVIVIGLICLVITVISKIASAAGNLGKDSSAPREGSYTVTPPPAAGPQGPPPPPAAPPPTAPPQSNPYAQHPAPPAPLSRNPYDV